MIKKENFKQLLENLEFIKDKNEYYKKFPSFDCELRVDFKNSKLIYPEESGLKINERQTCNFSDNENFVVFECVHRLLIQGYNPKHIELEPKWQVGHGASGGRADILVRDNSEKSLLIIECKTAGAELKRAWDRTQIMPTQIFSYARQETSTQFIALYASDFIDEKVKSDYYLISLKDNEQLLEDDDTLQSYKSATSVEELYDVWVKTYEKDFATLGLFETNRAYEIGKNKFSLDDLKTISSKDIQGKYHEFATVLRQHNVSGRENAFDKLVSLFLCKLVDEKHNADELKFYYKGRAYDSPYDLQDRLQQLYQKGMKSFLDEDITYIDNEQIDIAFGVFKDRPNETKEVIKGYFKQLKFYTNNDFAFIDVHNKKLFDQNFEVLLKIIKLFQDIKLTGSEENQFLGDMFEGFLDQGVKQSEGQFFTPMPIVKFIVNSLPQKQDAKVIDYACGAGHFLNEYACANENCEIVGIEKEYRLSKVAKVSSFMYSQNIDIIYADALAPHEKIKNSSFDTLIANPPYSVKGFLETLKKEDREAYRLINAIDDKSYTANNSIECFFIERAIQLLKAGGDAGIIVPSSILTKGSHKIGAKSKNVYVQTRELILKYFHIVAIAEFGSGTFGKTGTNTVTLFLKRRETELDISRHLTNMVNEWFIEDLNINKVFKDEPLLNKYIEHIGFDNLSYKTFLRGRVNETLQKTEMFEEYKKSFENLTETKHRKKQKTYKSKTKEEREKLERKEFLEYTKALEKDKLLYFTLAFKNDTKVVIVKAPSDGKENKSFLGYEWSGRKGDEGIKFIGTNNSINTPLYNPKNRFDTSKINNLIVDNFDFTTEVIVPDGLEKFVSTARLVDMLDFSRVEVDKGISLISKKNDTLKTKWELVQIADFVLNIINGSTPSKKEDKYWKSKDIQWVTVSDFTNGNIYISKVNHSVSQKALYDKKIILVPIDSVLISCTASIGKVAINKSEVATNQQINALVCNLKKVSPKFLAYYMSTQREKLENLTSNTGVKHVNLRMLNSFKIPLPPLNVQKEIVKACEKIDIEVKEVKEKMEKLEADIISLMQVAKNDVEKKISDICEMKAGKFISASKINHIKKFNTYTCYGGNGLRGYVETFTHDGIYALIGRQGALCGNITLTKGKFHATEHAVVVMPKMNIDTKWLYHKLIIMNLNKYATGVAQPGLSVKNLDPLIINVPSLENQKFIVQKIEIIEEEIAKAQSIINESSNKKEAVLKEFL